VPGHLVAGLLHIDRVDVHIGLARLSDFRCRDTAYSSGIRGDLPTRM